MPIFLPRLFWRHSSCISGLSLGYATFEEAVFQSRGSILCGVLVFSDFLFHFLFSMGHFISFSLWTWTWTLVSHLYVLVHTYLPISRFLRMRGSFGASDTTSYVTCIPRYVQQIWPLSSSDVLLQCSEIVHEVLRVKPQDNGSTGCISTLVLILMRLQENSFEME